MSRVRVALALVPLAVAAVLPAPVAAGAFPGENGKIVYVAGDDVFTVAPDGAGVRNVTNAPGLGVQSVSASPDGKRVAFNVTSSNVRSEAGLYVVDMRGTSIRDVLRGRHREFVSVGAPAWSPDGERIAFEAFDYPAFRNELFVIDADGSDLRRLTDCNCVGGSYPVWSPVADEIAFVPCCNGVVTVIDAATGETSEVYAPEAGEVHNLTWSPDGTQLAFDDRIEVYRVSIAGGTPIPLTSAGTGSYYSSPSWSPDGAEIVVESSHESPQGNGDLYAIDATEGVAGGVRRITTAPDAERQPDWAPQCEAQCTVTKITLRIRKTKTEARVRGRIRPRVPGRATVTLFEKTPSGYREVASAVPMFHERGRFWAIFRRRSSGRCKVRALYAGDAKREPTRAVKTFVC